MICARCDEPIKPHEGRQEFTPDTASGAAPTAYIHAWGCKAPPHQTAPYSIRH